MSEIGRELRHWKATVRMHEMQLLYDVQHHWNWSSGYASEIGPRRKVGGQTLNNSFLLEYGRRIRNVKGGGVSVRALYLDG